MSILERYGEDDELKLEEVEKEVANRWRWEWLEGTVVVDHPSMFSRHCFSLPRGHTSTIYSACQFVHEKR